jgi:RimJ/RimL family protein N-acetyltransferase
MEPRFREEASMRSPCARYHIRELTGADAPSCSEFVDKLERHDVRRRFASTTHVADALLPRERPEGKGTALGAFGQPDALLGVVNLEPLADGDIEIAIIVRSDFQRRGAGYCLMSQAIALARNGLSNRLVAYVSPENRAANALVRKLGFRVLAIDRYAAEIVLPLRRSGPSGTKAVASHVPERIG